MELGPSALAALNAVRGQPASAANLSRAAKSFGEELARWAFEQGSLRNRAKAKFEKAEEMLFDRDGLEMATHEKIARFHATRFPPGIKVADLTCGTGIDLIALAREGPAVGFEVNPHRAALARHNLAVHRVHAEVIEADCLTAKWDFDYAFADPARRSQRGRTLDPDGFQPPLDALVQRMSTLKLGLIKVSPMLPDDVLLRYSKRVDFLSYDWECREAILRVGSETEFDEGYWAAKTETGQWLTSSEETLPLRDEPGAFLLEADPAAIRSHSLSSLAEQLHADGLGDSNGFLTTDSPPLEDGEAVWVRRYRVHAFGHADPKRIRAELRASNAFVKVVKTRAIREDPIQWAKKLRTDGPTELILILYPVGKSLRFALVEESSG